MKASIIIATIFFLQAGIIFAGNDRSPVPVIKESVIVNLAPDTPTGATFEDSPAEATTILEFAPVIPAEATFEDLPVGSESIIDLPPIIRTGSDCQDVPDPITVDIQTLAPVTPAEADFE